MSAEPKGELTAIINGLFYKDSRPKVVNGLLLLSLLPIFSRVNEDPWEKRYLEEEIKEEE